MLPIQQINIEQIASSMVEIKGANLANDEETSLEGITDDQGKVNKFAKLVEKIAADGKAEELPTNAINTYNQFIAAVPVATQEAPEPEKKAKATKAPKSVKAPKAPKEPKPPKAPKPPKEPKAPRVPKAPKVPKSFDTIKAGLEAKHGIDKELSTEYFDYLTLKGGILSQIFAQVKEKFPGNNFFINMGNCNNHVKYRTSCGYVYEIVELVDGEVTEKSVKLVGYSK